MVVSRTTGASFAGCSVMRIEPSRTVGASWRTGVGRQVSLAADRTRSCLALIARDITPSMKGYAATSKISLNTEASASGRRNVLVKNGLPVKTIEIAQG